METLSYIIFMSFVWLFVIVHVIVTNFPTILVTIGIILEIRYIIEYKNKIF